MISGDSHIDLSWLPADLFTANAPRKLQDRVPRVVNGEPKDWVADGVDLGTVAGIGFRAQRVQWLHEKQACRHRQSCCRREICHVDACIELGVKRSS